MVISMFRATIACARSAVRRAPWRLPARTVSGTAVVRTDIYHTDVLAPASVSKADSQPGTSVALPPDVSLALKAMYVARKIDVYALLREVYFDRPHSMHQGFALVSFADSASPFTRTVGHANAAEHAPAPAPARHMALFEYGAVVFLNFEPWMQSEVLDRMRGFLRQPFARPCAEDYGIVIRRNLGQSHAIKYDYMLLRDLDVNAMKVIAGVMGQTVAMQHYELEVDSMLSTFSRLNEQVESQGEFQVQQKELFRLIAQNNAILTDVITKIGILDRSETAWKFGDAYERMWQGLKNEFELRERFTSVDFKLDLIQQNTKFFLEILNHKKSDKLEWIIIFLIAGEIALSVYNIASHGGGMH